VQKYQLHLTMHQTIGLTDYYRTISGNNYWTNGLLDYCAINGLWLKLGVQYSALV